MGPPPGSAATSGSAAAAGALPALLAVAEGSAAGSAAVPSHSRRRSRACSGTGPCERSAGMPSPFTLCMAARDPSCLLPPGWSPRSHRLRWFLPPLSASPPGTAP
eukprot:6963508-Pyramimonas_sp.AAC.1